MTIILIVSHISAYAAGGYCWYRFGTSLRADADLIRNAVKKL